MPSRKIAATVLAGLAFSAIAVVAIAQDITVDPAIAVLSPQEMVAKREELMKSNGGTLRNAGSLTGAEAVAAADTLVSNFSNLTALFPDSTKDIPSDALPAVWENHEAFAALMLKAVTLSTELKTAAESGDAAAYGTAMKAVGAVCGECHQQFRS